MNSKLRLALSLFWLAFGIVLVVASVVSTFRLGLALIGAAVSLTAVALIALAVRSRAGNN